MMNTQKIAFASRTYTLPRTGKPSFADKLDKVFQVAEHVDARCVYMLSGAQHRRRLALSAR